MATIEIPVCACGHPLDAHDLKENFCILYGCSCLGFIRTGRFQKVEVR